MNMKTAFVFPGQGSQSIGMLTNLVEKYPIVHEMFSKASDALGYDLWEIVETGPAEKLNQTTYTQPAMLVADLVYWHIAAEQHEKVHLVAGHSLGEYAALVAAGAIDFIDAVKLVSVRGQIMQEAVPADKGAMAVILGLDEEKILAVCEQASQGEVVEAVNFNSPGQIVLAGEVSAIDRAIEGVKHAGAKIAKKLPVSVPSHCRLMKPAAEKFDSYLKEVHISSPIIPVINNVDVMIEQEPDKIRQALVRQLYCPVRWIETINLMVAQGIHQIVECGPGKVLTGLNKRINPEIDLIALSASI